MKLRTTLISLGSVIALALAAVPATAEASEGGDGESDSTVSYCLTVGGTATCFATQQARCEVKTYSTAGFGALNRCVDLVGRN